jgi:hypothetical protein
LGVTITWITVRLNEVTKGEEVEGVACVPQHLQIGRGGVLSNGKEEWSTLGENLGEEDVPSVMEELRSIGLHVANRKEGSRNISSELLTEISFTICV